MSAALLPSFGLQRPPQDPQRLARLVLSEPRFRVRIAHVTPSPWAAFLQWLHDRWNDFARIFSHSVHVAPGVQIAGGDVLLGLCIVGVLAVAIRLGAQYVREFSPPAQQRRVEPRVAARGLYVRAGTAAEAGRWAEAIALLFAAALALLDVRGLLHDDPSRTVNECRRDVRASAPACSAAFDRIAQAFTAAAFAGTGATPETWAATRAAYEELMHAAPGGGHAA